MKKPSTYIIRHHLWFEAFLIKSLVLEKGTKIALIIEKSPVDDVLDVKKRRITDLHLRGN